jgi:outer membrane protein assembly factor BamA
LDYEVPYLDKSKKRGIHLELGYMNNREVWYKTEQNRLQFLYDPNGRPIQQTHARLSYSYRPGIFSKHRFTLGHETIRVSDTVLLEVNNPFYLDGQKNHQSALFFHYTYKWDRRDIAYYPLKGHFLEINFEPRLLMETGNLFAGFWLNAEKFFDLGKSFYAGLGFRAKTSIMENQPYSLYQSLGYKFFVRGFEPYVVDGQHYALVQSTIKYCMFREDISLPFISIGQFKKAPTALYLSLFTDGGYVSSTQFSQFGNDYSNRWLQGFGAGLDLATYYDRVIRIEYSINNFGRKGLYLHFTASI